MDQQEFDRIFAKANELWEIEFFQKHYRTALETHLQEIENEFSCQLHSSMRNMDSPLEAAFLAWWKTVSHNHESVSIYSQYPVEAAGQNYRLDFALKPSEYSTFLAELAKHPQCPHIAVELDGHDFHEKTKEQATYRNRRDRDLQAAGWVVLHVSGSEFNANPERVVKEIYEQASNLFYAAYHRLR